MSLDEYIDSDEFRTSLETAVDEQGFPDPDPGLVPRLTEARYVEAAARDAGEDAYADELRQLRQEVVEPLEAFDQTMAELEQELGAELDEDAFYDALQEKLSDREQTFLDYPAPPHHMLEATDAGYRPEADSGYRRERERIEHIVSEARELAREAYRSDEQVPVFGDYSSAEDYADVVAFNTALAAESMLDQQGEIVTPP